MIDRDILNNWYKILRKNDIEILKHFCDEKISNEEYFNYGIYSDIISNLSNVITNYLIDNLESSGVDVSCRIILEAMVILKMNELGEISEKQKEIYRYLYAYVDSDNFHSILKDNSEMETYYAKQIKEDKEKATQAMVEHFKCFKKDLQKRDIFSDDPCFYLKKSLKEKLKFSSLVKKYPIGLEGMDKLYSFFSIFIHPRCEIDQKVEGEIMTYRQVHIDNVLMFAFNFLESKSISKAVESTLSFDEEFSNNPILQGNVMNIYDINIVFEILKEQTCRLPNGYDWFTGHFLEKAKHVIIDMMVSKSLGYKEHIIANFKSFIEEYSVYFAIGSSETQKEFDNLKCGFWYSSRLQIIKNIEDNIQIKESDLNENIRKLFDGFYRDRYQILSFEDFFKEFSRNSFFYLDNETKSYNRYVRKLIETAFTNVSESKEIMTVYRFAKDMGHASGYNFNASEGIIDVFSSKAIVYVFKFILHYVSYSVFTLSEHNVETNLDWVVFYLSFLSNCYGEVV